MGPKNVKLLAENGQEVVKSFKKFRNFLKIIETPPECILGILEPSQPSKIEILSKIGFFKVFHTPDLGILESFLTQKFQNPCRKWPKSGEKLKKIRK